MDNIFKEWEKRLSTFESSVEKDLAEIRKCKAEMQQMQLDMVAKIKKGHYLRDPQRIVLSAPEIIIGNVDHNGTLYGGGSVIVRGTIVGLQGVGEGGQVQMRAPIVSQTAEDPGPDGQEHVVGTLSEVVSHARNIIIQSDDTTGTFSALTAPTGSSGVRIHADKTIDVHAAMTAESREKRLDNLIKDKESLKKNLKEQASAYKESFGNLVQEIEGLMEEREKLLGDEVDDVRTNYEEIRDLSAQIEESSLALTEQTYAYAEVLSMLAEANRQLKCFKDEKSKIKKGDDFTKNATGSSVKVTGENILLLSVDGENNYRDNDGSGISMIANSVGISSIEKDGKLKEKGKVSIKAMNVEVATAGIADTKFDDKGELEKATYTAEGDFTLKSKNITFESVDYEVADKKYKEKQLTDGSKIKLRAKTIEVSTEGSANMEVDEEGKVTKANYTSEGDIIVTSKTFTLNSTDTDIENGETKEKALTSGGRVAIRAEKMDLSATDTEGKATGSVNINAKAVGLKSMDVEKEKRTDDKLAEGGTMTIVSENMYMGAKSKDVKSKKVQVMSEEIGAFADKTLEVQQDEGKALVQLDGGNLSVGGGKTQIYGETTINAKTEVKDELKAPKATIENLEAKTSFKSQNISDGIAVPGAPANGNLSAKLKAEDAPEN